jgi:hypothetical protein
MIYLLKIARKVALLLKMDCIDLINEDIEKEECRKMRINLVKRVFKKRLNYILVQEMDTDHYCLYDRNLTLIRYFLSKQELFQYVKMLKLLGLLRG